MPQIRGVGCLGALPLLEHIDLSNNSIDSTGALPPRRLVLHCVATVCVCARAEGFGDLLAVKVLRLQVPLMPLGSHCPFIACVSSLTRRATRSHHWTSLQDWKGCGCALIVCSAVFLL